MQSDKTVTADIHTFILMFDDPYFSVDNPAEDTLREHEMAAWFLTLGGQKWTTL